MVSLKKVPKKLNNRVDDQSGKKHNYLISFSASGIDIFDLSICVSASRIPFLNENVHQQAGFTDLAKKANFCQNFALFKEFMRFFVKAETREQPFLLVKFV